MNRLLPLLIATALLFTTTKLSAQQVPSRMKFANMDLRLTAGAIKDIQADVDALTRSEKYFQKKLERVDMYMPIIERIFKEEHLPDDFKYLVIQESALISDAVSSSNAVGFWQFKEISGLENDLRIDRHIDERMNIVSSSRAAANYLKNHNKHFDNWAYALIAYQRGRYGATDVINERNFGKKHLKITSNTYWYLKKFLAHKVAFENTLGTSKPPYYLKEIEVQKETSLRHLAKEENIDVELLTSYNTWVKRHKIPDDKTYTVIVPLENLEKIQQLQSKQHEVASDLPGSIDDDEQHQFPLIDHYPNRADRSIPHEVEINGLDGIYAPKGYTVEKLAEKGGLSVRRFRKFNDLKEREKLKSGEIYYLRRKRNRAKFYYHTVEKNQTMWSISQKYGVKLRKLYRKNRMHPPQQPKVGRVLWLRHNRPSSVEVEYREPHPAVEEVEKVATDTNTDHEVKTAVQEIEPTPKAIDAENPIKQNVNDSATFTDSEAKDQDTTAVVQLPTTDNAVDQSKEKNSVVMTSTEAKMEEETIKEVEENTSKIKEEKHPELMDYTIKKGDTFFSIANRFNMKISSLLSINELQIRDPLSIGQVIKVNKMEMKVADKKENLVVIKDKATSSTKDSDIQHTVSGGETMYSLAKKYNVSLQEIMEWNSKEDYQLRTGEIIVIKQK